MMQHGDRGQGLIRKWRWYLDMLQHCLPCSIEISGVSVQDLFTKVRMGSHCFQPIPTTAVHEDLN